MDITGLIVLAVLLSPFLFIFLYIVKKVVIYKKVEKVFERGTKKVDANIVKIHEDSRRGGLIVAYLEYVSSDGEIHKYRSKRYYGDKKYSVGDVIEVEVSVENLDYYRSAELSD